MIVFVSALDWGLGHATRILPTISKYYSANNKVIIGASKRQVPIYKEFFPEAEIISFQSFSPKYCSGKSQLLAAVILFPKFVLSILREHQQLKRTVKQHKIDLVISDNRYGLFHSKIKSIFIGHQLSIKLPAKVRWMESFANRINRVLINCFDECWIPDLEGDESLAGDLSKPSNDLKIPTHYIGIQSRFNLVKASELENLPQILVLISGPENQRTDFEELVVNALNSMDSKPTYLIVRGLPEKQVNTLAHSVNHCQSDKLKALIQKANYIICRSGYSTLMDLKFLKRKALLVPTPGQTEQEYLAEYFQNKYQYYALPQHEITVDLILKYFEFSKGN